MNNILQNLTELFPTLSKKHQLLASYILKQPKEVAFMTLAELATKTDVSNATVTRFAINLGYKGFPDFIEDIQKVAFSHLSPLAQIGNLTGQGDAIFDTMVDTLSIVSQNYAHRDIEVILEAAKLIGNSKKVFVTGYQWCKCLVESTCYELKKYTNGVIPIQDTSFTNYELIGSKPQKSCAIVFALPRYPAKTIAHIKHFESLGIPIILFTDEVFPYAKKAKCLFTIPLFGTETTVVFPLLMSMLIIQEIISHVIMDNPKLAKERVAKFEESTTGKYLSIEDLF